RTCTSRRQHQAPSHRICLNQFVPNPQIEEPAMANARRCIVRPASNPATNQHRDHQIEKLRTRLGHERGSLARWQTRLKRAFTTVEKHKKRITRLERQIAFLED